MDNLQADWLAKLSTDWQDEQKRRGYLVVDAKCDGCGDVWLAMVHRSTMGLLQCHQCSSRGCSIRVYARTQDGSLTKRDERKLAKRWPNMAPIIHRKDGSIEEGKPL